MRLHVTLWFEDLKQWGPLGRLNGMTDGQDRDCEAVDWLNWP
jgi:hypothetical protein